MPYAFCRIGVKLGFFRDPGTRTLLGTEPSSVLQLLQAPRLTKRKS